MASNSASLKQLSHIALAALAVLFVGGVVFYKERLFFADASYIVFNIIKNKEFQIQEHRYGSIITQLAPWLCCKLHLPINFILKAYAFSFNLFFLLAGIVVYRCRQYALVIVMSLYYFLMVSDTYFWTNNEIHQAVAWMFIFYAVILRMGEKKVALYWLLPVFLSLAFLAIYTHFIVLIPFVFLWGFLWIKGEGWPFSTGISILLSLCIAGIVASKFFVVKSHTYDEDHLHNILHVTVSGIFNAFLSGGVRKFVMRTLTNYWLIILLFPAGLLMALKSRKPLLAAWCVATFIGYVAIMGVTYPQGDMLKFHIESEWQSMGIITSAAFVFYCLPAIDVKRAMLLLSLVFVIRVGYICTAINKFKWRTDFTAEVMKRMRQQGITKLAIGNDAELKEKYILDWAVADESMLMSAMQHEEPQITFTFIDINDTSLINKLKDPKMVSAAFDMAVPAEWNYEYYKPDTLHPYRVMTYRELFK